MYLYNILYNYMDIYTLKKSKYINIREMKDFSKKYSAYNQPKQFLYIFMAMTTPCITMSLCSVKLYYTPVHTYRSTPELLNIKTCAE